MGLFWGHHCFFYWLLTELRGKLGQKWSAVRHNTNPVTRHLKIADDVIRSLRKHPFLLALRRWGATEIPYWWRKSFCVYVMIPVVMGFKIQICPISRVFWSILVKCCVHLPTSSSKTQTLLLEESIFHKYWLFCERFFAFTFDLCGLLSVIRKQ